MITNVKEFGSLLSEGGSLLLSSIKAGRKMNKLMDKAQQKEQDSARKAASSKDETPSSEASCSDEQKQQSSLRFDNKPSISKQDKATAPSRKVQSRSCGSEPGCSGSLNTCHSGLKQDECDSTFQTREEGGRGSEIRVMSVAELKREILLLGYNYRCKNTVAQLLTIPNSQFLKPRPPTPDLDTLDPRGENPAKP
jgi:hypothetical protein